MASRETLKLPGFLCWILQHTVHTGDSGTTVSCTAWKSSLRSEKHRLLRCHKTAKMSKGIHSIRPDWQTNPPCGYSPNWPSSRPRVTVISWRIGFKWEQRWVQFAYDGGHGLFWTEVTLKTFKGSPAVNYPQKPRESPLRTFRIKTPAPRPPSVYFTDLQDFGALSNICLNAMAFAFCLLQTMALWI